MDGEKKKGGCLKVFLIVLLVIVIVGAIAGGIFYTKYNKAKEEQEQKNRTTTYVGRECPEFEVTTTDGKTVTKSELLDGKEVLCIVMFATWCGPCEREFPAMDKVYQKYQDKLSMIALDVDKTDDEEAAKEYADSHGLAFPIAKAEKDVLGDMGPSGYPTTLIIDRNGKVVLHRIGGIPYEEDFEKIVTTFMGDDYQERSLAYYTFIAYTKDEVIPGVEFTVTNETGTETYVTGEDGAVGVFNDKPEDMKIKVTKVPDGYKIEGNGEMTSGIGSTYMQLPVGK